MDSHIGFSRLSLIGRRHAFLYSSTFAGRQFQGLTSCGLNGGGILMIRGMFYRTVCCLISVWRCIEY